MENNNQIPEDVLNIIKSSSVYIKLEEIGNKFDLNIDQVGELNVLTEQVMIGKLPSSKYIDSVAKELEITRDKAREIVETINSDIFIMVKESIRKAQEKAELDLTPPPPTPVIRSPYLNKPAPVVKQAPSLIEKHIEPSPVQNVVEKQVEAQIEKALPTPPPPTNLPGVTIPEKINYNPFVKPIDDKSQMDIKKIVSEEDVSHEDIAKIEEMGNFTIERHTNETHNDPYREPLI
jgi:hypothetical protein